MASADQPSLRAELLTMAADDLRLREDLARSGALFEGYHPRMRALHERNAAQLLAIIETHGWPRRSDVGDEAADAAWLVLQHAIGNPRLQKRGLSLLREAAAAHEASLAHVALLEDRILVNEGREQRYGTQFDWDEAGQLSPRPIADETGVDERRAAVGMAPLADDVRRHRRAAAEHGEKPPEDWHARQAEILAWRRAAGWCE